MQLRDMDSALVGGISYTDLLPYAIPLRTHAINSHSVLAAGFECQCCSTCFNAMHSNMSQGCEHTVRIYALC